VTPQERRSGGAGPAEGNWALRREHSTEVVSEAKSFLREAQALPDSP